MKDINNPLIKAYYDAISALGYNVYEGEEPDDIEDKLYFVISDITSNDISPKQLNGHNAQIQITGNSWEVKYNNRKVLNTAVGNVLEAIKPNPTNSMNASGINIIETLLVYDRPQDYGKLANRVYVSRHLIFSHLIFYSN